MHLYNEDSKSKFSYTQNVWSTSGYSSLNCKKKNFQPLPLNSSRDTINTSFREDITNARFGGQIGFKLLA